MTDLFFPHDAPQADELRLIKAIYYTPASTVDGEFFSVLIYTTETGYYGETTITVPKYYHEHLHRFLWRHQVYMELQVHAARLHLVRGLRPLLQRYIAYMDSIVEGLLTTVQKNKGDFDFRSSLFDLYLVVEYYVGRHEYDTVGAWRADHPEIILECQDTNDIPWVEFYKQQDEADPIWSGSSYGFTTARVLEDDWQTLADRAAQHLGQM